ncbi:MAG TPA: hypothetical protein VFZ00_13500 [Solirubrobacter sp.]|nr:hypothetical protein [Solirubrobacter sp.]
MGRRALIAVALALPLTACGAQATNSASEFEGEQAKVAELVDQLAAAGRAGDAEKICNEILAKQLVTELKSAGGDCVKEMDRAIDDASDFDLRVRSVKIAGDTATAQVRQGDGGTTATFTFVKEGGGWRASALGG